jgi:ribosome-associated protein
MHELTEPEASAEERPSKSQRKREMTALQVMGERLVALSPAQLAGMPLAPPLRQAIEEAQRITAHSARRRQLQFIGKLMRDADAAGIRQAFEQIEGGRQESAAQFHRLERWRSRLLEGGDDAFGELLAAYPQADRQQLHLLVRSAQQELAAGRPPAAARKLFRYLRSLQGAG